LVTNLHVITILRKENGNGNMLA